MAEPASVPQPESSRDRSARVSSAVRLELRNQRAVLSAVDVHHNAILIGTVPGCDLRLPGSDLPPLLFLLLHENAGLRLRKLAPAQPLLVNNALSSDALLGPGDSIQVGSFTVQVSFTVERAPADAPPSPALAEQRRMLEDGLRKLHAAQSQFDEDRRDWEQDAERQAEMLALRSRQLLEREKLTASAQYDLQEREQTLEAREKALDSRATALLESGAKVAADQQEVAQLKDQLRESRAELHAQYSKRRDALAAMREAVSRAAATVQQEKRGFVAQRAELAGLAKALDEQRQQLEDQRDELAAQRETLERQGKLIEDWQKELEQEYAERNRKLTVGESSLKTAQQTLSEEQGRHQQDLVRLERWQGQLQETQTQHEAKAQELNARAAQLQKDAAELAEQVHQTEEWDARLRVDAQDLQRQRTDLDETIRRLSEKSGNVEAQQVILASLRTRAERLQVELRQREEQLVQQRLRLDRMETQLGDASRKQGEQEATLRQERDRWQTEKQQIEARCTDLEVTLARMRELQAAFEVEQRAYVERLAVLEESEREVQQRGSLVRRRAQRLHALKVRLVAERQKVQERESQLVQTDQTRETLQEQLRKRSEALAEREQRLAEQVRAVEQSASELKVRATELEQAKVAVDQRQAEWQTQQAHDAAELARREALLKESEASQANSSKDVEEARQQLAEVRAQLDRDRQQAAAQWAEQQQAAAALQSLLPALLEQAQGAMERLGKAREHLRAHIAEVHHYTEKSLVELEAGQRSLAEQTEQLRQQHLVLSRGQEEQRLAVSSFRQSLLEWQEQLGDLKRSLTQGETVLDRRQAQLEEQARRIDETNTRLTERAEELEDQERDVAQRREELNNQLADMQHWYRHKLRELAERRLLKPPVTLEGGEGSLVVHQAAAGVVAVQAAESGADDRQLAELLTGMALIDQGTLAALMQEAKQRGSTLRDALLDGEYLTAYQMELIEAGKLEALVLGPLRVVDRIRLTTLETVYRVYDPRRGTEALLRCLSQRVPVERQAEFRERFQRASKLRHPNLAATLETLEVDGGPAALQEWVAGVPSTDWVQLAAPPSVWLWLVDQAAAGLEAAHAAGLDHGHLSAGRIVLTEAGELRVCGIGEPSWLSLDKEPKQELRLDAQARDLKALGLMAARWLTLGERGPVAQELLAALQQVVARLVSTTPKKGFPSAKSLREHVDELRRQVPEDQAARERLLALVRSRLQLEEDAPRLRASA